MRPLTTACLALLALAGCRNQLRPFSTVEASEVTARRAAIRKLALTTTGTPACLELDALLDDAVLAGDVLFALERISDPEAERILVDRLHRASALPTSAIIRSLGARRAASAVPSLLTFAGAQRHLHAVIPALARIGDDRAEDVLRAALQSDTRYEADWLRFVEGVARRDPERAATLYVTTTETARLPQTRSAALLGLVRVDHADIERVALLQLASTNVRERHLSRALLVRRPPSGLATRVAARLGSTTAPMRGELLRLLTALRYVGARELVLREIQLDRDSRPAFQLLPSFDGDDIAEAALGGLRHERPDVRRAANDAVHQLAALRLATDDRNGARALVEATLLQPASDALLGESVDLAERIADPVLLPLLPTNSLLHQRVLKARLAIAANLTDKASRLRLLDEIARGSTDRGTRTGAIRQLKNLGADTSLYARAAGFLPRWHVLGSFPKATDPKSFEMHPFAAGPTLDQPFEVRGKPKRWKQHETIDADGHVDLTFLRPNSNAVAYAFLELDWPRAEKITLKVGSDDGVALWVNGQLAHANFTTRGIRTDNDTAKTHFLKGKNHLLVKVSQGGGGWEFCVRVADDKGKPIDLTR